MLDSWVYGLFCSRQLIQIQDKTGIFGASKKRLALIILSGF